MTSAPSDRPLSALLQGAHRIHLIGIAGSGMSSLAILLARQGKAVSGSDVARPGAVLTDAGVVTFVGHDPGHLDGAELIIRSAAIPLDNAELIAAGERGIPVLTHAQALGALMASRVGVAVAGTHGKTTTTAMLGLILERVGLDPTVLVGATARNFGSGARLGLGRHLVVEADEYDRRFLSLKPFLALITSIEPDHLDYFSDLTEIVNVFRAFAELISSDGWLVTSADDSVLCGLEFRRQRVTYGHAEHADWRLSSFEAEPGGGCHFRLHQPDGSTTAVQLRVPGRHNASNAAGAIAAANLLGVPPELAAEALAEFVGTERRFQTAWQSGGLWIVDDYAHHPTAVRSTLTAAREVHTGRLLAVFQPHTTNRVASLLDEFARCFEAADEVWLLPIYHPPGRESGEIAVTTATLATAIKRPAARVFESLEDAELALRSELRAGDLAIMMGAGDITQLTRGLVRWLSGEDAGA